MNKNKRGFTILEILVVLAVLAILIGIAVPRIKGMQDQANITKVKSELKTVQLALESYYINHGEYPTSDDTAAFGLITKVLALETPQIVPGGMPDPFGSGNYLEYFYKKSANGKYYVVGSVGLGEKDAEKIIGEDFGIKDGGVLTDKALAHVADGVICVTNGSGCD